MNGIRGSRTYYTFIKPNGEVLNLPDSHPSFQHYKENRKAVLKPGLACAKHSYFCGIDCGVTLMLHPDDFKFIERKNV